MNAIRQTGNFGRLSDREFALVTKPRPFSRFELRKSTVLEGLTIWEIVQRELPEDLLQKHAHVTINGDEILPGVWHLVRPKPGTLVNVNVVPQGGGGGGGGGKNPLRTVLSIAVIAASFVIPMAMTAGAFGVGGQSIIAGLGNQFLSMGLSPGMAMMAARGVVGFGITLVGNAVVNAIAPPPAPGKLSTLVGGSATQQAPESPTLSITGTRNRANPYGPVPRVYGRHRVHPVYAALPFTEIEGDDQYLNVLFDFGYGPLELSDLRIGTNPLSQFENVDIEIREGYATDAPLTLYRNQVREDSYNIRVTNSGGSQSVETRSDTDEFSIDIGFNGLTRFDNNGNRTNTSVELVVDYREIGSTGLYTPVTGTGYSGATETAVTETLATDGQRSVEYETDEVIGGGMDVTLTVPSETYASSSIYGMKFALYVRADGETDWKRQYEMSSYLTAGNSQAISLNPPLGAKAEIKIENTAIALNSGSWDGTNDSVSSVKAVPEVSWSYGKVADEGGSGTTTFTEATANQIRRSIRVKPGAKKKWEIRVTRNTADNEPVDNQLRDDSFIVAVRSVTYADPTNYEKPHCRVAMRAKGTNQLTGVIDEFSAIAEALLPVWNGSSWSSPQKTRNPAWAYVDALKGNANNNAVADSRLNLTNLKAWADANDAAAPQSPLPAEVTADVDEPSFTFDHVIDYSTTVFETLKTIASAGRAGYGRPDGKFGVVRDVQQSTPVQLFTPRNSWGFRGLKTFHDQPHALRTRFVDPDSDWKVRELTVYDDGYTSANATKFETLELVGITRDSQAWRDARYHIAVGRLRPETFEIHADIENLVCERGDLVALQHDVPRQGGYPGRVKSITTNAGNVETVTIDDVATMDGTSAYKVKYRQPDGTVREKDIDTGSGDVGTFTFSTPEPIATAPAVGDLVVVGITDSVTEDFLVKEIDGGPDLSAKLTLIPYGSGVYTADTGTIPAYNPNIAYDPYDDAPRAVTITSTEVDGRRVGTSAKYDVVVNFAATAGLAAEFEIFVKDASDTWIYTDSTKQSPYRLEGRQRDESVSILVRGVSRVGRKLSLAECTSTTVTVTASAPDDVADFALHVTGDNADSSWTPNDSDFVSHYVIRWSPQTSSATWGGASPLVSKVSHPTSSIPVAAMTGTYLIKAVDWDGFESVNAATVVTTVPDAIGLNVVETLVQNPTFAGTHTNTVVVSDKLTIDSEYTLDQWSALSDVDSLLAGDGLGYMSSGTYEFDAIVNLTAKHPARMTAAMTIDGQNIQNTMATWDNLGEVASLSGTSASEWNATLYISTTDDDPTGSPTWSDWQVFTVGDYAFWGAKFQLVLTSASIYVTPEVSALSVQADIEDRTEHKRNISISAAGTTITFDHEFKAVPTIGITGLGMETGDYFEISNESTTGFDLRFFNSSDVGVARNTNHFATGYGKVLT